MESFKNNLLSVELINNIFLYKVLKDEYIVEEVEQVKQYFRDTFTELNNSDHKVYGCIFDLRGLTTFTMLKFGKQFKNFFQIHEKDLHKYFICTSVITDNTFIRVVVGSIAKLVNNGRPFLITSNNDKSYEFVQNRLTEINSEKLYDV